MHDQEIEADEYLWETLPGRCCFQGVVDSCDTCAVWSDPQNFCHLSKENCERCGAFAERIDQPRTSLTDAAAPTCRSPARDELALVRWCVQA